MAPFVQIATSALATFAINARQNYENVFASMEGVIGGVAMSSKAVETVTKMVVVPSMTMTMPSNAIPTTSVEGNAFLALEHSMTSNEAQYPETAPTTITASPTSTNTFAAILFMDPDPFTALQPSETITTLGLSDALLPGTSTLTSSSLAVTSTASPTAGLHIGASSTVSSSLSTPSITPTSTAASPTPHPSVSDPPFPAANNSTSANPSLVSPSAGIGNGSNATAPLPPAPSDPADHKKGGGNGVLLIGAIVPAAVLLLILAVYCFGIWYFGWPGMKFCWDNDMRRPEKIRIGTNMSFMDWSK